MYNDHPRDPRFAAVVDRWSFLYAILYISGNSWSMAMYTYAINSENGDLCRQVVVSSGLTVNNEKFWPQI